MKKSRRITELIICTLRECESLTVEEACRQPNRSNNYLQALALVVLWTPLPDPHHQRQPSKQKPAGNLSLNLEQTRGLREVDQHPH